MGEYHIESRGHTTHGTWSQVATEDRGFQPDLEENGFRVTFSQRT